MRYFRPSVAVFALALLASLSVHLPIYSVLGVLAEVMLEGRSGPLSSSVQFELADFPDEKPPDGEGPKRGSRRTGDAEDRQVADENPEEPRRISEPLEPPEPKPVVVRITETAPETVTKAKPEYQNRLAVRQKSENPDVEPPEDARFIAKENRRVEQETVAVIRNLHRDDDDPSPSAAPGADTGELGDAERFESADFKDRDGSDERPPTRLEAEAEPSRPSERSAGKLDRPALARAPEPGASPSSRETSRAVRAGASKAGGEEQALVVRDGMGTFRVLRDVRGRGPGKEGGEFRPGAQAAKRGERSGSRARSGGPNLRMTWSQFEETFGAEELRQRREAYLRQRRSKARGGSERRWQRFRAAIENFVSNVRPGNQTALNAAASPFAEYISDVHRRIHREFAFRFIRSLPVASGPFSDSSLHTELEIVFNRDGSIHKIGIIKTSGFLPFDYGAFESVLRAQPYPEPPPQILSGDGRVYVHWGFYRNPRMCGTFNVKPFILPNPPGTPHPDGGPLRDNDPSDSRDPG